MAAGTRDPDNGPLYMGFDLSTQQLKALVIRSDLTLAHEAKVDFDADFGARYGLTKGVLTHAAEGEVFAPVALWLDALTLVLDRLRDDAGCDFGRVRGISGAGMQHGTVFWSEAAEGLLQNLDPARGLAEQLAPPPSPSAEKEDHHAGTGAFAHPMSPNWQDASTQAQCEAFDAFFAKSTSSDKEISPTQILADVTGSKAHHRFSGPQILRYRTKYPHHYAATARISLVSSFLASVLLGAIAPIDIGDVGGMNLFDNAAGRWHAGLLALAAGEPENPGGPAAEALRAKLGDVVDGGADLGPISHYFAQRYGFSAADCRIIAFTGDNPATILALPLRAGDAMVSLGTSTTFLMSTPEYRPDPAVHFMPHPTTRGLYMFMLCYKNGGLARELVRDQLNAAKEAGEANGNTSSWDRFNQAALETPPLAQASHEDHKDPSAMRLGLYFPRPEIVPNLRAGFWRYGYEPQTGALTSTSSSSSTNPTFDTADARAIIESQLLSLRLRSKELVHPVSPPSDSSSAATLPPQPRRVYLVGGGSANPAIAQLAGAVLGGAEGVYRLDIGGNACALGAAHKALWGCERRGRPSRSGGGGGGKEEEKGKEDEEGDTFEAWIGKRWDEGKFVRRVADGYQAGLWERYGVAVEGFAKMERKVLEEEEAGRGSSR